MFYVLRRLAAGLHPATRAALRSPVRCWIGGIGDAEAQVSAAQEAAYGQKTALEALTDWEERCQTALDEARAKTS